MKEAARAQWIANFDMESLVSSILRNGTLISMGLILASLTVGWVTRGHGNLGPNLQARSVPFLILEGLEQMGAPGAWPHLLIRLSVAALLITPYARVLASMVYFTWVDRSRKQAFFTGFVLILLTIILLTTLV